MIPLFLAALTPILETVPEGPFSYPGQSPREVITVDPAASPLLTNATEDLKKLITSEMKPEQILSILAIFVREALFDMELCDLGHLYDLLEDTGEEEIPLDLFLKERIGVCRHIALTTTYLLNHLIKKGVLRGKAFLIRDNVSYGRHAWTLFLTDDGAWHIDSYLNILENAKTEQGFSYLCSKYGPRAMERQKQRWEKTE